MKHVIILNIITTLASIGLIQVFGYLHIGSSDIERALFTFACWVLLFFLFLVTNRIYSQKIAESIGYVASNLLLEGILLFTGAVTAIAIYGLVFHTKTFPLSAIPYFSYYYILYALIIKTLAQSKYLGLILIGGLVAPIVIGFVVGILNFIFILLGSKTFGTFLGQNFMPLFFIDLALTIGTGWYYALTGTIANIHLRKS